MRKRFAFALLMAAWGMAPLSAAGKLMVHEWGVLVIGRAHGEVVLTAAPELLTGLPRYGDFKVRARARGAFRAAGNLGLGVLNELAESDDPEVGRTARVFAAMIGKDKDLGVNALRPNKETAEGIIEALYPPRKELKLPRGRR